MYNILMFNIGKIFKTVEITKSENVCICIINDLSDELKNYIKSIFVNICQGDGISYEYKSVLKDFIERIHKNNGKLKSNKHLKGIVGELLSHALIKNRLTNMIPMSFLFNLEEESPKKSFDIIFMEKNNLELWFSEIKAGSLGKKDNSSQDKNKKLLRKAKNFLNNKFNNIKLSCWSNAINHAMKINLNNRESIIKKLSDLYNEKDSIDNSKNVILSAVVYNDTRDKISLNDTKKEKNDIEAKKEFNKIIVFSIQKNTYIKVIDFLKSELEKENE